MVMEQNDQYDHFLIRDATVLVRSSGCSGKKRGESEPEFYDVRTGVQLRGLQPPFQDYELTRGQRVSREYAGLIMRSGMTAWLDPSLDPSKVVTILDIKQRRLDAVVADSIIDQVRVISELLQEFVSLADGAQVEERFWLSQQVLSLIKKFSGRELSELEDIVDWFKTRHPRK